MVMSVKTKFKLTKQMRDWVKSKRRVLSEEALVNLLEETQGRCALSQVKMRFDAKEHLLYASVGYISPANKEKGYQIICRGLNDIKGHLPFDCFEALQGTEAWKSLMRAWRYQWEISKNK